MAKYVYMFKDGNKTMRARLGGKGANLAEMTKLGLPVPNGFVVGTNACLSYFKNEETMHFHILNQIDQSISNLEKETNKKLGDSSDPLLLSVRSGSRASMPGMMDTVLNLGINDQVAEALIKKTDNPWFVYDTYRRFIQMYSDVVSNLPKDLFENYFDLYKEENHIENDSDLTVEDLKHIVKKYKENYKEETKEDFPEDPKKQLLKAVEAVFKSWKNERAVTYRRLHNIPYNWGTAVNVQEMVYGNMGDTSGSGVAFTRNPATGVDEIYGEFLLNAQGEDVVAGVRTPISINKLKNIMPDIYDEFVYHSKKLEKHYKDMQDLEFTIEEGKLYILQTRNGKRTAHAAIKIAVDLFNEGKISKDEALLLVDPNNLDALLHPIFDQNDINNNNALTHGLPASPGAAVGKVYFNAKDATKAKSEGEKNIILVRKETSPEDIEGMSVSSAILTLRGGMTSHAAVVARGMGIPAVVGASEIIVDEHQKILKIGNQIIKEDDYISLDGTTGNIYLGKLNLIENVSMPDFDLFSKWVNDVDGIEVRTNAEINKDAKVALNFGATGIGLCRTEHMFFDEERILSFRKMILSKSIKERASYLSNILPYQTKDFESLYKELRDKPVTIRLLDPPLHEFLPHEEKDMLIVAKELKITLKELNSRIDSLKEFNPMMGHRGVRLSITYPEILEMQIKAILMAAINMKKQNINVKPEIMIPLVADKEELLYAKKIIHKTAKELFKLEKTKLDYKVGTMIELPRACLLADEIAPHVDFFSFGTNDLTQMTYGISRDDASKYLDDYFQKNIYNLDPFQRLDIDGVGKLIKNAIELAKKTNPRLEFGVCGEHGGETFSINFFEKIGLDYVSCSPYRVPTAKLAAAQISIRKQRKRLN